MPPVYYTLLHDLPSFALFRSVRLFSLEDAALLEIARGKRCTIRLSLVLGCTIIVKFISTNNDRVVLWIYILATPKPWCMTILR